MYIVKNLTKEEAEQVKNTTCKGNTLVKIKNEKPYSFYPEIDSIFNGAKIPPYAVGIQIEVFSIGDPEAFYKNCGEGEVHLLRDMSLSETGIIIEIPPQRVLGDLFHTVVRALDIGEADWTSNKCTTTLIFGPTGIEEIGEVTKILNKGDALEYTKRIHEAYWEWFNAKPSNKEERYATKKWLPWNRRKELVISE